MADSLREHMHRLCDLFKRACRHDGRHAIRTGLAGPVWPDRSGSTGLAAPAWQHRSERSTRRLHRRIRRGRRLATKLSHELIELSLILGETQTFEEGAKFLLLFLESAKSLGAVFVECAVAGRRAEPLIGGGRGASAIAAAPVSPSGPGCAALPWTTRVIALAAECSATHTSAPYHVEQNGQANRPPEDETQYHDRDAERPGQVVQCPGGTPIPGLIVPRMLRAGLTLPG